MCPSAARNRGSISFRQYKRVAAITVPTEETGAEATEATEETATEATEETATEATEATGINIEKRRNREALQINDSVRLQM